MYITAALGKEVVDSYHAGDDVVMVINEEDYAKFLVECDKLGIKYNKDKQVYLKGRCEWLRKTFYSDG